MRKELPSLRLDILLRIGWGEGGRRPDEVSPERGERAGVGGDSGSQLSTLNHQLSTHAPMARANFRPSSFDICNVHPPHDALVEGIPTQNRGLPCICPTPPDRKRGGTCRRSNHPPCGKRSRTRWRRLRLFAVTFTSGSQSSARIRKTNAWFTSTDSPDLADIDFDAPSEWAVKMQAALSGAWRPYAAYRDYALNETPFINPKAMLEHLKKSSQVQVRWRGEPAKRGFPEEKITAIFISK